MTVKPYRTVAAVAITALCASSAVAASSAQEERSLNELRNTVVNLLQALVQRGVLTREQAEAMVKSAEEKAAADGAAAEQQAKAQEQAEAGAVRVPYVPQVVKDEIRKEVADQLAPEVTKQVISEAKSEQWGIPGALPDWIKRVSLNGDMRVRAEGDVFPRGNVVDTYPYLNWTAINAAGGYYKAGQAAFLNTSIDRYYLNARLRLNFDAKLSGGWSFGSRLTTGTLTNPDSTNQILGQYGGRYPTNIDLAYLKWVGGSSESNRHLVSISGGKMPNPFMTTDLVWDNDVTFEGVAATYRLGVAPDASKPYYVFATAGAFPIQEIPLTPNQDKWLYAEQLGIDFQSSGGSRLRLGAAYYNFNHTVGQQNTGIGSHLLDYTAPVYTQKGNTVFDISSGTDVTVNTFALAAEYRELDAVLLADWMVSSRYRLGFYADYVKNLGYKEAAVSARYGADVPARVKGYQAQLDFGSARLDHGGAWHAFAGYRYLQRDAVMDAFTDQDYHLGGTDAKGYFVGSDVGLTDRVWLRLRYMAFDAIDGPPFAVDNWQVDFNASF